MPCHKDGGIRGCGAAAAVVDRGRCCRLRLDAVGEAGQQRQGEQRGEGRGQPARGAAPGGGEGFRRGGASTRRGRTYARSAVCGLRSAVCGLRSKLCRLRRRLSSGFLQFCLTFQQVGKMADASATANPCRDSSESSDLGGRRMSRLLLPSLHLFGHSGTGLERQTTSNPPPAPRSPRSARSRPRSSTSTGRSWSRLSSAPGRP